MPRKATQHEFRLASAGTRTRVELLPGDVIAYDALPSYTIKSEAVGGGDYQLPHLPDEWMFDDRDIFIRDVREELGGSYRGLRALKAGNLYMEWAIAR